MYLSKNRTFRFWLTVYSPAAFVPAILYMAFLGFVRDDLVAALGPAGPGIASKISIALSVSFIASIVLANLAALWHQWRGIPDLPEARKSTSTAS